MSAKTVIGAQLYTLRDHCKTSSDFAKTCKRLREMGYGAVQVSAVGPIETPELARILNGEGLVCAATHQSLDKLRDTAACVDYHQQLGCKYTAIGGWKAPNESAQEYRDFAKDFSSIGQTLGKHGLKVGYHNHSQELAHAHDCNQRILDILIESTDPAIWFEIDTYWVVHGGGDPVQWIDKVAGRIPCVHVKDMSITTQRVQKMSEVGAGNLNWPAILQACKRAGVEWYLVERDNGDLDPFESLKISLDNLRAMGLP